MSSQTFSTFSEVGMIDARSQNGIITLPLSTDIPYRILTLKDIYGASVASSITLTTQGADVFEDGTTSRLLNGAFETTTLYAGQAGYWYTTGGSRLASAAIGSLSTGLITNPLRLGTLSTQTSIQFPGLRANYTGTVIAGQTTGAGTQELLLYQASTISDQIRLQTTGNIVFEAGASARSFPSTQMLATPTLYIAGTTSNVGIGTATPGSLLDVAGVARAQTISTLTLNTSTINGIIPGAAFNGSTTSLSSATITTSTLATNIFTTSSITSYGNVDIQGSILSNVATEYFVKPVYTSVFTPASIPNLKVWADASKLTSITSNGSGLVLLLSNLTGLGNFASNAGLTPPTTGAFTMNNLNTLSFGGANALVLPSITYTSAYRSLFVVAQTTGNTPFFGVGSPTGSITTANYGNYFYAIGSNANISYYPISGSYLNMPLLVSLYTTSTSNGIFLNGSNIGAISPATFATGSFVDQLGVAGSGGLLQGNYYGASWNFCEVLLYDGVLTPAQRQLVEGYLGWKWGFQTGLIATQPYYSSVPPPFGTAFVAAGSITTDANSNVSFAATNKIRLTAAVEIPTTLIASSMTVSSINGSTVTQLIGAPIQSTVIGLATAGYISSTQLNSTVSGLIITAAAAFTGSTTLLSAGTINVSTLNSVYLSSVQGYVSSFRTDSLTVGGATGYVSIRDLITGTVSTGQIVAGAGFISSLQINTLSFGPTGYVIVGNFIASSLSTMKLNTQNLYTNNAYIGNVSSQSAILFPGVDGNFRGTAVAEQTTGAGTGELLLYKVSTTTDQIRLQTTGNIVFEAGASQRSWPSTAVLATPTLFIQGTTSNVGIGTAAPAATLDVAGSGRFQTLSTQSFNVSTINGIIPGAAFNGSTLGLSTATLTTSTLGTNALTTSSITSYGTVDVQGNVLSNVGTEYFIKPLYTTTFLPTNISGLKVWLDASKPTSITSNGSGQVATWSNLTGLGNAVQITASNTPVTGQLSINSLNTMQFNAISQMTFGPISYSNTSRIVFAVLVTPFNPSVNGKTTFIFGGQADGSIGTAGFHAYQWSGSGFEFTTSTGGGQSAGYITYTSLVNAGTFSSSTAWLLTYHSGFGIFLNGTSNAPSSNLNTGSITDIFGTTAQGTNVNSFYIAEFLHYDTSFTATQRQTVEGYLAWKWGFQATLNGAHPYLSVPPPPLGTALLAMGGITADTSSNISFSATNKIRLTAPVEIPTTLTTSSLTVSSINSSTISQIVGFPIQSTMIGLGSAGYVSTANLLGHVSTANLIGLVSTQNLVGLVSTTYLTTQLQSTVDGLGTVNYISSASFLSTTRGLALQFGTSSISSAFITATQGYISSLIVDSLAIGSNSSFINMGGIITTSISSLQINTGLFTASGAVCTPQLLVSSINGQQPLTLQNLTSTVTGTNSNISSMIDPTELTSTITGLGTVGFISAVGLTYVVASTAQGLGTFGYTSTNQLLSTTLGIYGAIGSNIATTVQPQFTSTVQGLGTAGYISSLVNVSQLSTLNLNVCTLNGQTFGGPITSTLIGLGTAGYISSSQLYSTVTGIGSGFTGSTTRLSAAQITVSTISSFLITTGSIYAPAISTSAIVFGTGTGTLLMPDIAPNTLYTSTATASNVQVGWSSNQSPIQFYGFGTYSNSVIVEQSTGSTTQELLVFRGSNIADRIRLQTTGYLSIETGVSSRLYPNTYSNALPTIMIDTRSNVGILLSTPVFSLDVGSTVRAIALSTLLLQTSTIQGATFNRNLYVNYASTFLMDEVSTSFLQGNYNSLLFRTAGTQRAVLTQAGYLGIGTSNPQYFVDIAGTTRLSTLYYSTSISYNLISAPLLMASTVNTGNVQVTNVSTAQVNTSTIYGRWDDAQYYVLQTL